MSLTTFITSLRHPSMNMQRVSPCITIGLFCRSTQSLLILFVPIAPSLNSSSLSGGRLPEGSRSITILNIDKIPSSLDDVCRMTQFIYLQSLHRFFNFLSCIIFMNQAQEIKCNQCLLHFTTANSPFSMPTCKHNICSKCLAEAWQNQNGQIQCEFCAISVPDCKDFTFKENTSLLKKIKAGLIKHDSNTDVSNSRNQSFKVESGSLIEDQGQNLLDQLKVTPKKSQQNICSSSHGICAVHEKQLEIICATDLKMICAHCAIFGNHKDHKFKTIKEFNKDLEEKCELLQTIQKQKYVTDKKVKAEGLKEKSQSQIANKKKQLIEKIENKFSSLVQQIRKIESKVYQDLEQSFELIEKQIKAILDQQNKVQIEFAKWQAECENIINKIQEQAGFNNKISLMYGPLKKLEIGPEIVQKLEKRNQVQSKKIQNILASVTVEFSPGINLSNLVKVNKKPEEKKQSFMNMLEKINIPSGSHLVEEADDFEENSFVCDFGKEDLSLILEGQVKKTQNRKKTSRNQNPLNQTTNLKIGSPTCRKLPASAASKQKLTRSKSNYMLPNGQKPHIVSQMSGTEKRISRSRIAESIDKKDPEAVIKEFIKQDLKEVLDLSRCQLDDQTIFDYLKQVRRHRKMRGLKLSQNQISDIGFNKIVELLGSTTNLNLSYNKMTEQVLGLLIKNRDKFAPLRIINLSFNKVNEKKARIKIEALKKMGIIVNI